MKKHGYSQIPVVENGKVLGVFSFRSFSKEAASKTLEEWMRERLPQVTAASTGLWKNLNSLALAGLPWREAH